MHDITHLKVYKNRLVIPAKQDVQIQKCLWLKDLRRQASIFRTAKVLTGLLTKVLRIDDL